MPSATIKVEVDYDPPSPQPTPPVPLPPATTDDKIEDTGKSSLSGSGDSSGASTDATEPNKDEGSDNRQRKNPVPNGATFKSATVTITMTCDDGTPISLTEPGNVSASARVDGSCITNDHRESHG